MKKILVCCALISTLSANVSAADYYLVGIDAFKKGSYDKACSNLEHAIRVNPKNVNARYYLAQVYLRQRRTAEAKNQYNRIILLAPSSDAARLSQRGLSLIQQSTSSKGTIASADELAKYKDNYLDYVLSDKGDIGKWQSFPLTVYIEPSSKKNTAKRAFEEWQKKSQNLVSFKFSETPENAQITVGFKDKIESTSTKESFFAGFSRPYYKGVYLSKSEITVLTTDPETKQEFDDNFIFATTLHELGHSLGFIGHSPNSKDVMSASSTEPKTELTKRDLNTLNIFYRIDKNTLSARKGGNTDLKLQQALDYIKGMPEKSIGWSNLGDIYQGKKMYSDAIKSYKKAISLEPDRANPYSSMGVAYRLSGDKQNAYINFKKACDLDKKNTFYISQLASICSELNHKDVARKYIDDYLKANPDGSSDENMKKLLNYR